MWLPGSDESRTRWYYHITHGEIPTMGKQDLKTYRVNNTDGRSMNIEA